MRGTFAYSRLSDNDRSLDMATTIQSTLNDDASLRIIRREETGRRNEANQMIGGTP